MTATRILSNISLIVIVALLFAGCSLLPGRGTDSDLMERNPQEVTADDPAFTEVSEDDSLDAIEAELDATVIEDEEDLSGFDADLDADVDVMKDGEMVY